MSATKTITYLTYFYPGSFFDEESSAVVDKRDANAATEGAYREKMAFNAQREDHKHEARKIAGGKQF